MSLLLNTYKIPLPSPSPRAARLQNAPMPISRTERIALGKQRVKNILLKHLVATMRTLEQKISDAGPSNQRINPHLLTRALLELEQEKKLVRLQRAGVPWFHLAQTNPQDVDSRLQVLEPIHAATVNGEFVKRLGQSLEIAVFKALRAQTSLAFFGGFRDLEEHDDDSLYSHDEPPKTVSGHTMPGKLDFMVLEGGAIGAIEIKNTRPWIYPDTSDDVLELLRKCCATDLVPVLIARRIHYSTFSVLSHCGVILHQTYNQLYPRSDAALAMQAREKNLLGYHDIRLGNEPDARPIKFIQTNLPALLQSFRERFERFKDLLCAYAQGEIRYKEFAGRSKRRLRGEPEDLPEFEPPDEWEIPDDYM
jgi:hypothetical protein